ncbi:hypothetical protein BDV96DRAFT_204925 [Lophiotrema nucula]|uniref:Uncharacterized protein n=1 Tax=Lophiotrema nucula TaxID=690887 RepID=A0A6A5ZPR6_9PLEO|nr:hypothetical protein BDV96DRAFT_204925 [Lophiotrema nucula]
MRGISLLRLQIYIATTQIQGHGTTRDIRYTSSIYLQVRSSNLSRNEKLNAPSTLSNAQSHNPVPKDCPCYTATAFSTSAGCPAFSPTAPCIGLPCIFIGSTITIPGSNTKCPKTPTITSSLPCQTACPVGCQTYTFTKLVTDTCLPTKQTSTPAYPTDTSSFPTTSLKPTITEVATPPPSRPCYTKTVTKSNRCPEDDLDCVLPDCILLSTALVPSGPVAGCPTTPKVTASRTCKGRCDGACATQWITATATAWKA